MSGVGCDFSRHLQLPSHLLPTHLADAPRTLFYPGSSIGNFDPDTAVAFLRQTHAACQGGSLLIGFDLVKEQALLDNAYNDALGITAAFNLNLLKVLRAELDATLKIGHFRHIAFFNAAQSRIEMHLEARRTTSIRWGEHERCFMPGERIHTEYSHKYTQASASALLESAGFKKLRWWSDPQQWFAVCWAQG
jgi:dimethylhistidine N-methyltransferase